MALVTICSSCGKRKGTHEAALPAKKLVNVAYGNHPLQQMDVYLPAGRSSATTAVMLLLHGGAWVSGDKVDMNDAVLRLQQLMPGVALINVNYRLGALPATNIWPAQLNDVRKAIHFIQTNAADYHVDETRIALGGASAGAHLALLAAYTDKTGVIKAVADLFGPSDMTALYQRSSSYQSLLAVFMSGTPGSNPVAYRNASPIAFVDGSPVPTIILHGSQDYVVPVQQSEILFQRLQHTGVKSEFHLYSGEGHGFWTPANTADAFQKIATFVQNHLQ